MTLPNCTHPDGHDYDLTLWEDDERRCEKCIHCGDERIAPLNKRVLQVNVWVIHRYRQVLITDDPGVPLAVVCVGEPRYQDAGHKSFECEEFDVREAMAYAETTASKLGYRVIEEWRFAPWADTGDEYDHLYD